MKRNADGLAPNPHASKRPRLFAPPALNIPKDHREYILKDIEINLDKAQQIANYIVSQRPTELIIKNCKFLNNSIELIIEAIKSYNTINKFEISSCYEPHMFSNEPIGIQKEKLTNLLIALNEHKSLNHLTFDLHQNSEFNSSALSPLSKFQSLKHLIIISSRLVSKDIEFLSKAILQLNLKELTFSGLDFPTYNSVEKLSKAFSQSQDFSLDFLKFAKCIFRNDYSVDAIFNITNSNLLIKEIIFDASNFKEHELYHLNDDKIQGLFKNFNHTNFNITIERNPNILKLTNIRFLNNSFEQDTELNFDEEWQNPTIIQEEQSIQLNTTPHETNNTNIMPLPNNNVIVIDEDTPLNKIKDIEIDLDKAQQIADYIVKHKPKEISFESCTFIDNSRLKITDAIKKYNSLKAFKIFSCSVKIANSNESKKMTKNEIWSFLDSLNFHKGISELSVDLHLDKNIGKRLFNTITQLQSLKKLTIKAHLLSSTDIEYLSDTIYSLHLNYFTVLDTTFPSAEGIIKFYDTLKDSNKLYLKLFKFSGCRLVNDRALFNLLKITDLSKFIEKIEFESLNVSSFNINDKNFGIEGFKKKFPTIKNSNYNIEIQDIPNSDNNIIVLKSNDLIHINSSQNSPINDLTDELSVDDAEKDTFISTNSNHHSNTFVMTLPTYSNPGSINEYHYYEVKNTHIDYAQAQHIYNYITTYTPTNIVFHNSTFTGNAYELINRAINNYDKLNNFEITNCFIDETPNNVIFNENVKSPNYNSLFYSLRFHINLKSLTIDLFNPINSNIFNFSSHTVLHSLENITIEKCNMIDPSKFSQLAEYLKKLPKLKTITFNNSSFKNNKLIDYFNKFLGNVNLKAITLNECKFSSFDNIEIILNGVQYSSIKLEILNLICSDKDPFNIIKLKESINIFLHNAFNKNITVTYKADSINLRMTEESTLKKAINAIRQGESNSGKVIFKNLKLTSQELDEICREILEFNNLRSFTIEKCPNLESTIYSKLLETLSKKSSLKTIHLDLREVSEQEVLLNNYDITRYSFRSVQYLYIKNFNMDSNFSNHLFTILKQMGYINHLILENVEIKNENSANLIIDLIKSFTNPQNIQFVNCNLSENISKKIMKFARTRRDIKNFEIKIIPLFDDTIEVSDDELPVNVIEDNNQVIEQTSNNNALPQENNQNVEITYNYEQQQQGNNYYPEFYYNEEKNNPNNLFIYSGNQHDNNFVQHQQMPQFNHGIAPHLMQQNNYNPYENQVNYSQPIQQVPQYNHVIAPHLMQQINYAQQKEAENFIPPSQQTPQFVHGVAPHLRNNYSAQNQSQSSESFRGQHNSNSDQSSRNKEYYKFKFVNYRNGK